MGIESRPNFTNQISPEKEKQSEVAILWKEYGFKSKPPKEGSPVEQRLIDKCKQYMKFVVDPRRSSVTGSESTRRSLHNEIAIMIMGQSREEMDTHTAEQITDFASHIAFGCSYNEAEKMYKDLAA